VFKCAALSVCRRTAPRRGTIRTRTVFSYCSKLAGRTVLSMAGSHSRTRYSPNSCFDGAEYVPEASRERADESLVAKFKIDGKEPHPSSLLDTIFREPADERAELPIRALGAEEDDLSLVLLELVREIGTPACGQLVALGTALRAGDYRPLLPHESRVPTVRRNNARRRTRLDAGETADDDSRRAVRFGRRRVRTSVDSRRRGERMRSSSARGTLLRRALAYRPHLSRPSDRRTTTHLTRRADQRDLCPRITGIAKGDVPTDLAHCTDWSSRPPCLGLDRGGDASH
jgi:hypothetical protein